MHRVDEPFHLMHVQRRERGVEVCVVLRSAQMRLVKQDDVRSEVRDGAGPDYDREGYLHMHADSQTAEEAGT